MDSLTIITIAINLFSGVCNSYLDFFCNSLKILFFVDKTNQVNDIRKQIMCMKDDHEYNGLLSENEKKRL